jgi:uncharacterized surface protein with fasciclin (FAS1) repeats
MKMVKMLAIAAVVAISFGAKTVQAGCGTCDKTIVENAVNIEGFKTLVAAVKAAGLVDTLSGDGPFTVFAPTDEAFAKLPKGTVENLLKPENKDQLVALLKYHVVSGKVLSSALSDGQEVETLQGDDVEVSISGSDVMINNAAVIDADVEACNGVIHVINKVLLPPPPPCSSIVEIAVADTTNFSTLVAAVTAADLAGVLAGSGPFTVFAPTNAAFAALPAGTVEDLLKPENKEKLVAVLTYHVVPGKIMSGDIAGKTAMVKTVQGGKLSVDATKGVKVDNAKVISADVAASNGVIHVIDTVVLPK